MSLWMTTASGRDHFLSGIEAQMNDVDVYDIAHHLAQINRFTGAASRPYSVAEHSLLCADLAEADKRSPCVQLACLLHDAHEAYTSDQSSPAKNAIGLSWARFETLQADRVRRHFHLVSVFCAFRVLINHYDLVALATERRDLMRFDPRHNRAWDVLDQPGREVPPASWVNLKSQARVLRGWNSWRDEFLERYFALQREVVAASQATQRLATESVAAMTPAEVSDRMRALLGFRQANTTTSPPQEQ